MVREMSKAEKNRRTATVIMRVDVCMASGELFREMVCIRNPYSRVSKLGFIAKEHKYIVVEFASAERTMRLTKSVVHPFLRWLAEQRPKNADELFMEAQVARILDFSARHSSHDQQHSLTT